MSFGGDKASDKTIILPQQDIEMAPTLLVPDNATLENEEAKIDAEGREVHAMD